MKTVMLSALALGLAPWLAPHLVQWAYPWISRQDAWHVAGVTAMCCWTPSCLIVGVFVAKWAGEGQR